jgi:hypothetical protein
MKFLGIVLMCVAAAVGYGVLHDQVTARVCVEYFTVAHPRIVDSDDPTVVGLVWGVVATWWAGLLLGLPLAIAARVGSRPQRSVRSLVRPVLVLLAMMAVFATVSGVVGFVLARSGTVMLPDTLKEQIPAAKWPAMQACALAHQASYNVAFIGGGMLIAWVWVSRKRWRETKRPASPPVAPGAG